MREYAYFGKLGWKTRVLNTFRGVFRLPVLETWLRHRTEGRLPGSLWVKMMPPEFSYPGGSRRSMERDGLKYELDISNATDHGAYFGVADRGDEHLDAMIKPEFTILDIGGNIGIRAIQFAALASEGLVVSFEPDPDNFARLMRHVSINDLGNVIACPFGIGPADATHKLYQVVESNSGMNRIITTGDDMSRFPFKEVRVMPLMKGLEGLPVKKVDMIKVDVEGFELAVLKGSEDVIRRDRPLLFVELDDDNLLENGSSARTLVTYLQGLSYNVSDAATMLPISNEADLSHCMLDIICVPKAGLIPPSSGTTA